MDKKILLVEDEHFISFLYKKQFEIMGHAIDLAETGEAALEFVKKTAYDLVLLDIMLPGINGIDVLKQIKSNDNTKNIHVIMITNLAQDDIITKAKEYGAEGYWIKANLSPREIVEKTYEFLKNNTPLST